MFTLPVSLYSNDYEMRILRYYRSGEKPVYVITNVVGPVAGVPEIIVQPTAYAPTFTITNT